MLVEASPIFRTYGERLAAEAELPHVTWRVADIAVYAIDSKPRDLVTMAYVLNELAPKARHSILQQLWQLTADTLVIVEPERRPAGNGLSPRAIAGAHARACPLQPPDWCHFAQRIARSRVHQQTKRADVPWEDEKFSYVAVSRKPAARVRARVIARPRKAGGRITLKLCRPDGLMDNQSFSRRDGAQFKRAWRTDWGSSL